MEKDKIILDLKSKVVLLTAFKNRILKMNNLREGTETMRIGDIQEEII